MKTSFRPFEKHGECPAAHEYASAREEYARAIEEPFLQINEQREIKRAQLLDKAEELAALAPDFVERSLRQSPFETRYLEQISVDEWGEDNE